MTGGNYNDPWLSKSLQLTLYPTTGLRERLTALYEDCGMTVALCTCHHPVHDHLYGKGRRVHTTMKPTRKLRCTTCGHVHPKARELGKG